MSQSQQSLQEHLKLLHLEQAQERDLYRAQVQETPLQERRRQGISWYPVVVRNLDIGLGQRPVLELERTMGQNIPHGFESGSVLSLFQLSENGEQTSNVPGVVQQVERNRLKLVLYGEEAPDWIEEGNLGLDPGYDETTHRAMVNAVQQALLLKDGAERLREVLLGDSTPRFTPVPPHPAPALNEVQQRAIAHVRAAEDVALVHGPPGTGKTTTLVEAIRQVLIDEPRVLVCAPSNTAVDLLVEKLAQAGVRPLRLGHPARIGSAAEPWALEAQMEQHPMYKVLQELRRDIRETRRQALRFRRNYGPEQRDERRSMLNEATRLRRELRTLEQRMTQDVLHRAQAIVCTLVGAGQELLQRQRFRTVFIDEAAQAIEGACWIAILKAQRVIFAGDHCQLPPTIKSQEAARKGLANTLFEKVMGRRPEAGVMLTRQYRMNEAIMGFSSLQFYRGELEADISVAARVLNPESEEPLVATPLLWVDTAGCGYEETLNPESKSYANPEEAALAGRILERLATLHPTPATLGVIAPYREQVQALDELVSQLRPKLPEAWEISVDTVDGFQGQERDIMLICMTRSNERSEIGFLGDTRRMNVAITRAKSKLLLIGDSATLGAHPFYRAFLEYVEAHDAWDSAWNWMPE